MRAARLPRPPHQPERGGLEMVRALPHPALIPPLLSPWLPILALLLCAFPAGNPGAPSAFATELLRGKNHLCCAGWLSSVPSLIFATSRAVPQGSLDPCSHCPQAGSHPGCPQEPGLSIMRSMAIAWCRDNHCHHICAPSVLPSPSSSSFPSGKSVSTCLAL